MTREFWLGTTAGVVVTLLVVFLVGLGLVLRAKSQVEERLDAQWKEYTSKTRPLLKPPEIPSRIRSAGPDEQRDRLEVDLAGWHLKELDGQTLDGEDLKGEVLFLTFWATWCAPCIAELPAIHDLVTSEDLEEVDVQFLLVTDEDRGEVERFLSNRRDLAELPFVLNHEGVPPVLWSEVRPTTLIVDCDGHVQLRHTGPADWSDPSVARFLVEVAETTCQP